MSRRLPALTPRKVIQALERAGFVLYRVRGSHHHFIHPDRSELLVTCHATTATCGRGTLRSIIKQTGLSEEAFLELL